jgi:hypothetical protein
MSKYTWGDSAKVIDTAPPEHRPGSTVCIVGVYEGDTRRGEFYERFPEGAVYTVEFEDGVSTSVHESELEPDSEP